MPAVQRRNTASRGSSRRGWLVRASTASSLDHLIRPLEERRRDHQQLPARAFASVANALSKSSDRFISTSLPFEGVIAGHSAVFRGLPRRRGIARETPETLDPKVGGPNSVTTTFSPIRSASCKAA
jgi:hypothetical protein